ncbi:hypothetical protein TNCV_2170361 [Trichonephila clavipes]|nr:hypothetical protein TNCV_2170361 [Trichonephila clavipes]
MRFWDDKSHSFTKELLASGTIQGRTWRAAQLPFQEHQKQAEWDSVRSNSWDAQLAVPNDPRYARLETNPGDWEGQRRVVTVREKSRDTLAV